MENLTYYSNDNLHVLNLLDRPIWIVESCNNTSNNNINNYDCNDDDDDDDDNGIDIILWANEYSLQHNIIEKDLTTNSNNNNNSNSSSSSSSLIITKDVKIISSKPVRVKHHLKKEKIVDAILVEGEVIIEKEEEVVSLLHDDEIVVGNSSNSNQSSSSSNNTTSNESTVTTNTTNTNSMNSTTTNTISDNNNNNNNILCCNNNVIIQNAPIAISQYTIDTGELLYQNQCDHEWFGGENNDFRNRFVDQELSKQVHEQILLLLQHHNDTCNDNDSNNDTTTTSCSGSSSNNNNNTTTTTTTTTIVLPGGVDMYNNNNSKKVDCCNNNDNNTTSKDDNENTNNNNKQKSSNITTTSSSSSYSITMQLIHNNSIIMYCNHYYNTNNNNNNKNIKSEFMAVMAHEIRTPLHQIVGYLDLLELSPSLSLHRQQQQIIKEVQNSVSILITIINDLLDYSKLENGKIQLESKPFTLDSIIKSCIATTENSADEKHITFNYINNNIMSSSQNNNILKKQKIIGDPIRLRQILLNLCDNAIKFTHQGSITFKTNIISTVTTTTTTKDDNNNNNNNCFFKKLSNYNNDNDNDGHHNNTTTTTTDDDDDNIETEITTTIIRFEISDTGIGIAPKYHNIIFEKYRFAHDSVSTLYGGSGLGLSICKQLTKLMGGKIGLQSSQLGKGSTFFVEIPFQHAPVRKQAPLPKLSYAKSHPTLLTTATASKHYKQYSLPQTNASFHDLRSHQKQQKVQNLVQIQTQSQQAQQQQPQRLQVLVVEDNKINQKVMAAMLKRLGHDVQIAENGQIAVDNIQSGIKLYDLVLMDIQMPVLDGIEATKQIRTTIGLSKTDLPIVGITASFQHSDLEFYINTIGMNDCLGKPLKLEKLKEAIKTYATCNNNNVQPATVVAADVTNNIDNSNHNMNNNTNVSFGTVAATTSSTIKTKSTSTVAVAAAVATSLENNNNSNSADNNERQNNNKRKQYHTSSSSSSRPDLDLGYDLNHHNNDTIPNLLKPSTIQHRSATTTTTTSNNNVLINAFIKEQRYNTNHHIKKRRRTSF